MQILDGQLVLSASDLVGDLACAHLTTLAREAVEGRRKYPFRDDPQLDLVRRRGAELEDRLLASYRDEGRRVHVLPVAPRRSLDALRQAEADTLAAMREGADVIYQATFFDGRWQGRADFLIRVESPSALGAWSYEVADAKLAREVRAAAVLQLGVYSERLAALQGASPAQLHVVTGDGRLHAYRVADFEAYYRATKARLEARMAAVPDVTYPEPVDHCRVCGWYPVCADRRKADDHLSRVAGMTRRHTRRFVEAGVATLTRLGTSDAAAEVPGMSVAARRRLAQQARLQLAQYGDGHIRYEWLDLVEAAEPALALLPAPTAMDVFLDIEADPWIVEGGIEYLLGVVTEHDGAEYAARWAHSREQEKQAFDSLMGLLIERLDRDPGMHVYHYGAYEETALKRLASRHAIRQDELDRLLRGDVLVDLHRLLVRSLRISEESYSLKRIEKLYQSLREGPVTRPGFALVHYERWREQQDESLLADLQAYNRDDCLSIWKLRAWLEERRAEWERTRGPLPRPEIQDGSASENVEQMAAEIAARAAALTRDVPADATERSDDQQARWLLAQLLDWHRREEKPQWWLHFDHLEKSPEELYESTDALVGLQYERAVGTQKSSTIVRFRYDMAQEHTLKLGDKPHERPSGKGAGEIMALDRVAGTIDLLRGPSKADATPEALVPAPPINQKVLVDGILRVADFVLAQGVAAEGSYQAVRDLLLRRAPRLRGAEPGAPIARVGESPLEAALRAATSLEETCLPVQGPPGTGKTYTGARMIVALVRAGHRVGITASAHDAITNMLSAVCEAADADGTPLRIVQKADSDVACPHASVTIAASNDEVSAGLASGRYQIAAGTAWLFARKDMETLLDVLFIDEAGQMSLANVVAMAGAARSVVLLGDPNQLPQVTQGTHPEGAGTSALEHVLGDRKTIAPERGLFLEETWRMHPSVCTYISEAFYESRLSAHETTGRQRLEGTGRHTGGVHLIPVEHEGCSVRSEVEAARIADLIFELLQGRWTDAAGATRPLRLDDVMIVAPYNAQVAEIARVIRERIGGRARVGTVDRFQGQEAPVAIYSMTTSSPEDAPRQMEFLYSSHRLNVALSRARGLAIVVGNPRLLEARCRTVGQMRLLNAFCRLREYAARPPATRPEPVPATA